LYAVLEREEISAARTRFGAPEAPHRITGSVISVNGGMEM
jgi:hypothetical protein